LPPSTTPRPEPEAIRQLLLTLTGLIAVAMVVAIVVTSWLRRRFRKDGTDPAARNRKMLLHYRDLHRQGDLSKSEFRSIKHRLASRGQPRTDIDSADQVNPDD